MEGIKKFFTNKIFLVTFITIIIVVIVAIFFMNSLNDNNKKNETETESTMNEETTITKPKETETTTKEKETEKEETTVNLREYYDNIIKGYIIENPDTVTDKGLFVTAIDSLEEVQGNIEDSFNSKELSESDYNDLNTMVNDLIDLYNKRIEEIENATTTSTEPLTKPVVQPTTTPEETTTKEEETTIINNPIVNDERTDESQNPYIERKDKPTNLIYNADGTPDLKNSIITDNYTDADDWYNKMWAFIWSIPDERIQKYVNSADYYVSFTDIIEYCDTCYSHFDIRDYYIWVSKWENYETVHVYHFNDNFELVEGLIPGSIETILP